MNSPHAIPGGQHVTDRLPFYVNNTLPAAERPAVQAHLEHCAACAAERDAWAVVRTATRRAMPMMPPETATFDNLWQAIEALEQGGSSVMMQHAHSTSVLPAGPTLLPGTRQGAVDERPPARRRSLRLPAILASAALVLAALGLSYLAFQWRPSGSDGEQPAAIPAAVVASATPAAPTTTTIEPLFATTLPADQVSTRGALDFVINRLRLEPEATVVVDPAVQACCSGPQITHVLEGELTVRVDGPGQIFRASGSGVDEVSPGADVTLQPGDTLLAGFALPTTYANQGTAPVELVAVGLHGGTLPGPWGEGFTWLDGNEEIQQDPRPAGPAEVRLVRATLPPGGEVSAPPPGSLVLDVGATGDVSIGKGMDGSLRNLSDQAETIYVFTVDFGALGTPAPAP